MQITMHQFQSRLLGSAILLAAGTVGVMLVATHPAMPEPLAPSSAGAKPNGAPIAWTPDHLAVTVAPGDTKQVGVIVNAMNTTPATAVWLVPSLASFAQAAPQVVPELPAGSQFELSLTVAVPSGTPTRSIEGTLHLRQGTKTLAHPLPITLQVQWSQLDSEGVSFEYSPLWSPQVILSSPDSVPLTAINSPGGSRLVILKQGGLAHDFPETAFDHTEVVLDGHQAKRLDFKNTQGRTYVTYVTFDPPRTEFPDFELELRPAAADTAVEGVLERVLQTLHLR